MSKVTTKIPVIIEPRYCRSMYGCDDSDICCKFCDRKCTRRCLIFYANPKDCEISMSKEEWTIRRIFKKEE